VSKKKTEIKYAVVAEKNGTNKVAVFTGNEKSCEKYMNDQVAIDMLIEQGYTNWQLCIVQQELPPN